MKQISEKHRKGAKILLIGFTIFINCFGFPIYNLGREGRMIPRLLSVLIVGAGNWEMGLLAGHLYPKKGVLPLAARLELLVPVGLLCRYLLEFGEVSNTYNFTLPNLALHLLAVLFCYWMGIGSTRNPD